ncbi:MAG: hypothetical protein Q7S32_03980 [bacterium]|nr:hypothetical protein [bacterium]
MARQGGRFSPLEKAEAKKLAQIVLNNIEMENAKRRVFDVLGIGQKIVEGLTEEEALACLELLKSAKGIADLREAIGAYMPIKFGVEYFKGSCPFGSEAI